MSEWLYAIPTKVDASVPTLVFRLLVAWVCGWAIAKIYRRNWPPGDRDAFSLTLILMSILIAMATQIIGDNIARAFSLVGALSIVRFRTAVPETRDMAFVLAAVVVGMAIGAGQYWVAGAGLGVVAMATQVSALRQPRCASTLTAANRWRLTLTVGLNATGDWNSELNRMTKSHELISAETSRRGSALELVYRYEPRPGFEADTLIATLNSNPAVESASTQPLS